MNVDVAMYLDTFVDVVYALRMITPMSVVLVILCTVSVVTRDDIAASGEVLLIDSILA